MERRNHGDAWFTFLGVRSDGAAPFVDLAWGPDEARALVQARSFLEQHPSCEAVEIWSDGWLRATVRA
jgi:hypothetical protein